MVGLDGSPHAPGVLATAVAVARARGAKLVLFRAVGLPPEIPRDFWKTTEEPLLDVLKGRAKTYLDGCQFSRRRDPSRQYFSLAFPPPGGEFLSIIPPSRLKFLTSIPPLA